MVVDTLPMICVHMKLSQEYFYSTHLLGLLVNLVYKDGSIVSSIWLCYYVCILSMAKKITAQSYKPNTEKFLANLLYEIIVSFLLLL